jgi:predicted dehydrogenase
MSKLRGAVIGIGGIGKHHAKFQVDTGRVELVGLCDANPKAKAIADKEFPGVRFFGDIGELLAEARPDLVSIATPHNLHAPHAIQCLKGGASVVVEKPMATTYADAQAMIAAAKKYRRSLTVYHNRRFDPWYLAAKSAIDDGLLGEVFEITTGIGGAWSNDTWRAFKQPSGGVMFDWGAHLVDYSLGFAASEVKTVSGALYRRPGSDPKRNEDHGSLAIRFKSGAIAHVTVSNLMYANCPRYRILGTKATLNDDWTWTDDGKATIVSRLSGGEHVETKLNYRKKQAQDWYDNVAAHLLDRKVPLHISAESAAKVINILCTAERSAKQGGVPLPLA